MQTTKNTATIWRTGFLWITTCFRVNRDAVTGGENRGHPILGRARIPTEHVDLKAPFMKEIPFSTSVASRRSLKEDKGEINPDADEEGLVKVMTGHMNIQCISQIREMKYVGPLTILI